MSEGGDPKSDASALGAEADSANNAETHKSAPAPADAPTERLGVPKSEGMLDGELPIGGILADRYQVLERLSAGGMGVVYKARHMALDDLVALKLLLKPQKEEDQRRFLLEARVATKIKHPNTVYISDFGVMPDGRSYLAMEFLQGQTLAQAIKRLQETPTANTSSAPTAPSTGAVPTGGAQGAAAMTATTTGMEPVRVCRIGIQIARGLQAVHDKGIIHRDLKPENIFLLDQEGPDGSRDFVKIVDFGIAKVTHVGAGDKTGPQMAKLSREQVMNAAQAAGGAAHEVNATLPGSVMGTPAYMSPEAIDGKHIDFRADQYSLGCVLYEMLTGHTPFRSRSTAGMLMKHLADPVPPLAQATNALAVPPSLEALVVRMLNKQPAARFDSMREIEQALSRELDLMLVARGEKVVLPSALAGTISGKGLGAALILGKRRVPLLALLPVALVLLAAGGLLTYRLALRETKPKLKAGELASLRQQAIDTLKKDLDDKSSPPPLRLGAGEPNPFRGGTTLRYRLNAPSHVRLTMFDAQGRQVASVVDDDRAAGEHTISMDASHLAPGLYLYRLETQGGTYSARAILLK